ncbi:MAG TPA: hypothetical protein VFQ95_07855 [Rhodanobacteraceae bacterium]|nr:hypothetical protein [Rhodanobacteraceae bacterium]
MKRFHVSLSVANVGDSIPEYTRRLGRPPHTLVHGTYAMWRTDQLNFSVVQDAEHAGQIRNLGFEDDAAADYESDPDVNGIVWERFSSLTQDLKITLRFGVPVYLERREELIGN